MRGTARGSRGPRNRILAWLATVAIVGMLAGGAVDARSAFGGVTEMRAGGDPARIEASTVLPIDAPAVLPSTDAVASLPPQAIDPMNGKPIWWSFRLTKDVVAGASRVNNDTRCPNGEECPDPLAP